MLQTKISLAFFPLHFSPWTFFPLHFSPEHFSPCICIGSCLTCGGGGVAIRWRGTVSFFVRCFWSWFVRVSYLKDVSAALHRFWKNPQLFRSQLVFLTTDVETGVQVSQGVFQAALKWEADTIVQAYSVDHRFLDKHNCSGHNLFLNDQSRDWKLSVFSHPSLHWA